MKSFTCTSFSTSENMPDRTVHLLHRDIEKIKFKNNEHDKGFETLKHYGNITL